MVGRAHVKTALVTGAARGIGAAVVGALARDGWHVLATDICRDLPEIPYALGTRDELDAVAVAAGERVIATAADARDRAALAGLISDVQARWGGLDCVVAAAGVIAGGVPAWELAPQQEEAVLAVDLGAVLTLARVAVPALLDRPAPRSGRFIAVASAAASRGLPMLAAYCAAKAGVAGFVRALAVELGDSGITANAVSPGSTDTAILAQSARLYGLADATSFAVQQPIGRLLRAVEVAEVIAFVASPASAAMTGAVIPVDGGLAL
jgi:SDR family mycofactocin-dependent oxidoreductase